MTFRNTSYELLTQSVYAFDSVPPGSYTLLVQKTNLMFDTDMTQKVNVAAGQSVTDNPRLRSMLGNWHILVDFGGGYTESGGLIFSRDLSAGVAYDYTGYAYGTWQLQDNNAMFSISGRDYNGILAGDTIFGTCGSPNIYFEATR